MGLAPSSRERPKVEQRCWVHRVANRMNVLPRSVLPTTLRMLAEIRDTEDGLHAVTAVDAFAAQSWWRSVNAPRLVGLVRAGADLHAGVLVQRADNRQETAA